MAEKEDRSNVEKLWVKQVLEVAECMEDDQPLRFKALLQKVPYQVKSLKQRHEITSEIQNIKALLSQIKEKNDRYKFKEQGSSSNTKGVIWHDPRLAAHFIGEAEVVGINCRIWITVSQSYNMEGLLKEMITQYYKAMGQTAPKEINTFNVISLIAKLRECLQNKRCVIFFLMMYTIKSFGEL